MAASPDPAAGYAELGARSNFSLLEGASHPKELVAAAKLLGHAALGVCDRNSFAGIVRAWVAAKECALPFVPGCRLELADGTEYLAWPTDRAAYGRLTRLLSAAKLRDPKGTCRIAREALLEGATGLVLALVAPDAPDDAFAARLRRDADALRRVLALPLFCAVAHAFRGDDQKQLDALAGMAGAAGARLLAAGSVLYHAAERRRLADVLSAIRLHTTVDALGYVAQANAERHLRPEAEMARLFARYPEALTATRDVVAACKFDLKTLKHEYPEEILEPGRTAQQSLDALVWEAAGRGWDGAGPTPAVRDTLQKELGLIAELEYAPHFLTVHKIVHYAKSRGILCQGRGSAANSAVCYVLGITAVDPTKHDLLFSRFLSTARAEPPDIDVDFEHERRETVIQWIYQTYGRDRAALTATLSRYRHRGAIREVGKTLGLSEDITAGLAKAVWGPGGDRTLGEVAAERGLQPDADPRLRMALELADEIVGFPRHLSTHVGGFVITRGPLVELAVVGNAAMPDRTTLEWDKDDIDALGLLKVDVLGLGMLSCLKRAFDLLERHGGARPTLQSIKQDDAATYKMLQRGDSIGVFQVESRAQMNMLPRLKPKEFYDLVIEVAIVRPGPIQGDMVHPYLRRRDKLEDPHVPGPTTDGDPDELRHILDKTLGVPLFQEQAMNIAITAAKFSDADADKLRRAMATFRNDGTISPFGQSFIDGMTRRGYPQDFAERCFKQIEGFGSYGFPESHAASFAQLVYSSAWIKCHHPSVFACALLNSQPMGFYAPAQLVRDAQDHEVRVRPVDVGASDWDCTLESDSESHRGLALRLGLRLVQGLSQEVGARIETARQRGPFAGIADLVRRAALDRAAVERLAGADAFRSLGLDRRAALWAAAAVAEPLPLEGAAAEPAARLPAATAGEQTVLDYASTALTLKHHPLALLRPLLRELGCADTRTLETARRGAWLRLPGLVLVRQRPGSAKGVVFFTVEDEHGTANLVLYKTVVEQFRAAVISSRLLLAEGRVERHEAAVPLLHLVVRRLVDRSDLLNGLHAVDDPEAPWRGVLSRADGVVHAGPPRFPGSRDFH